jgi:hypothetical protein
MHMKWWWNNDYESLMKNVQEFVTQNADIAVTNAIFGMKPDGSRFYYQLFFKKP